MKNSALEYLQPSNEDTKKISSIVMSFVGAYTTTDITRSNSNFNCLKEFAEKQTQPILYGVKRTIILEDGRIIRKGGYEPLDFTPAVVTPLCIVKTKGLEVACLFHNKKEDVFSFFTHTFEENSHSGAEKAA